MLPGNRRALRAIARGPIKYTDRSIDGPAGARLSLARLGRRICAFDDLRGTHCHARDSPAVAPSGANNLAVRSASMQETMQNDR